MENKGITSGYITLAITLFLITVNAPWAFTEERTNQSTAPVSQKVEISFVYQRLTGMASNQFAVWIEDSNGRYIKTLYTTRFTAKGGWQRRPQSLPGWVKASQPLNFSSDKIDAITGATPSSGNLYYFWDCKDENGIMLPAGEYKYIVEATLRWDNRVIYAGTIKTGGQAQQSQASSEYFGDSEQDRGMVTNVTARYIP